MMLPLMVLPLIFASCDTDDGSNPTLDLSHVSEGFVLNTPAYAENNTYDLINSEGVWLTCTQPNYGGGVPYVVNYYVQVSLDPTFAQGNADAAYTELPSSYNLAKMQVNARELNDAVVELYQKAHPDAVTVPEKVTTYIKLRACIDGAWTRSWAKPSQTLSPCPQYTLHTWLPMRSLSLTSSSLAHQYKRHGQAGRKCPSWLVSMVNTSP